MDCGVYQIQNTVDGKRYIGSSGTLRKRWKKHFSSLRSGSHHNPKLKHAWAKHGPQSFQVSAILYCDPDALLMYEELLIQALKPEYNCAQVGPTTLGIKYSSEVCSRMSRSMKGNTNGVGRVPTEEQMDRMRGNTYGKNRLVSCEERQKRSKSLIGNKNALGTIHTDKYKKDQSERIRLAWARRKADGSFVPVSEKRKKA